jgi:Ca-activated chloride channel family protein
LRGEIRDEQKNPLSNVRIKLRSSDYQYYSGTMGGFGISIPRAVDTMTIMADGFYVNTVAVNAEKFQTIILKARFAPPPKPTNRLLSLTKNFSREMRDKWTVGSETYSSLLENPFIPADKFPETGFAVNINKASYSNIRRFINMETIVPPDAIRLEEMMNYFNIHYTEPKGDSVFNYQSAISSCPWDDEHELLYLNICAKKASLENIPPANLVFLIDVSGSMDLPNRLPLLKTAFSLMVNNLRRIDTVSIVVYGGVNGVWLTPTCGSEKKKILESIAQLEAGGATPGEGGIRAAYRLAKSTFIKGGTNRVILATDGDFNVGQQTEEELNQLINGYRSSEIYLTCLGVGMGNYKDSKLEVLANRGKGNFAYLDNEKEAEKVLMEEFSQTIYAVAKEAYIDVRFDPAQLVIAEAPVAQHPRAEVLDDDVGDGDQPLHDLQALGASHVQAEALLVDVRVGEVSRGVQIDLETLRRRGTRQSAALALRPLDLDDLGPEGAQPARRPGPGPHPAEIHHANVFKGSRSRHGFVLLLRPAPGSEVVSGA